MFFAPGAYTSSFLNQVEKKKTSLPVLGAGCLKLRPLATDRFKTVHGIDRFSSGSVSFEFLKRPGWYIRGITKDCCIERRSKHNEKDCSFFPLANLWFENFVAFESVQKAAHYLRMKDGRLILDHYDGTTGFKEEASFKMGLKNAFMCTVNGGGAGDEEKRLLSDEPHRCSSPAASDCVCSDCVSVMSFQIYEENTHICGCSDCETDYANKRIEKSTK